MGIKEEIDAVVINQEVDGQPSLFLLLANDGTVNRIGTGAANNKEKALFIGQTPDELFLRFMDQVDEAIFQNAGVYKHADPKGVLCKLELAFRRPGGPLGFEFHFGTESEGPPEEISALVRQAIELTEPWYEAQKQQAADEASRNLEDD
ncbi:MAG TPA: hypothetical protein VM425_06270 [Myxococcota bacterium]|nr:hypothetical protein [Myxococcota bacterium]